MFLRQLINILLVAAFLYLLYLLMRRIWRIRRIVRGKRKEAEMRGAGRQAFEGDKKNQVIEIDKDHYKVE